MKNSITLFRLGFVTWYTVTVIKVIKGIGLNCKSRKYHCNAGTLNRFLSGISFDLFINWWLFSGTKRILWSMVLLHVPFPVTLLVPHSHQLESQPRYGENILFLEHSKGQGHSRDSSPVHHHPGRIGKGVLPSDGQNRDIDAKSDGFQEITFGIGGLLPWNVWWNHPSLVNTLCQS